MAGHCTDVISAASPVEGLSHSTVDRSDLARWYNQAIAELGVALAGRR